MAFADNAGSLARAIAADQVAQDIDNAQKFATKTELKSAIDGTKELVSKNTTSVEQINKKFEELIAVCRDVVSGK